MAEQEKSYNEKQLLEEIAGGDRQAFRHLFHLYKERLFTFAYGLTHSKVEAEEIVQDVFLKLWESRSTLTAVDHPQRYIFTMARNRTLDLLAKIGRNQKLVLQVWANMGQWEEPTEQILYAKESQQLINEAVAGLSERKQQVFALSRKEGHSHDEIADALGLSKQTVKNNLSEALKQIKFYLERRSTLLTLLFWIQAFKTFFGEF